MYVCMYVCRSVFVEMPMGLGVPTVLRGGTHRARGSNIPTTRHQRYHITHAGPYCACSDPTLIWAAKGVLLPHVGGIVTHRAHEETHCVLMTPLFTSVSRREVIEPSWLSLVVLLLLLLLMLRLDLSSTVHALLKKTF